MGRITRSRRRLARFVLCSSFAAQLSGTAVTVHYANTEGYPSCSSVPTYGSAPPPGYILLGDALE